MSYMKNVLYLAASVKLRFTWAIRSLGKHCFLPSLANRMIRMSKDEEKGKKKSNEQCTGRESGKSKPK